MDTGNIFSATSSLRAVKVTHTVVWIFFATLILTIPVLALSGEYSYAGALIAVVLLEVIVLATNGWKCPLTAVAARYTAERAANFDIYLPEWLARHNKVLFGALYVLGIAITAFRWTLSK